MRTTRIGKVCAFVAAVYLMLVMAASVSAHSIASVTVDCDGRGIVVEGVKFEEVTVTLTGPSDYLETTDVSGDWTHTFPLGPNGDYTLDWPNSGSPVGFTVECVAPKPTPKPTPTPQRTMPPTDTGTVPVAVNRDDNPGWFLAGAVFGATATAAVAYILNRTRSTRSSR